MRLITKKSLPVQSSSSVVSTLPPQLPLRFVSFPNKVGIVFTPRTSSLKLSLSLNMGCHSPLRVWLACYVTQASGRFQFLALLLKCASLLKSQQAPKLLVPFIHLPSQEWAYFFVSIALHQKKHPFL